MALEYPNAPRGAQIDIYHGLEIADPYRWLEALDSAETKAWVEAQSALAEAHLSAAPRRAQLGERLTALWNYPKYGLPSKHGEQYFFSKNDGLQNQSVIYSVNELRGTPAIFLDPNALSEDGTVALKNIEFTRDGALALYATSTSGSDWETFRVRDVHAGQDLPDVIERTKFSVAAWTKDNKGFFYARFDQPTQGKLEDINLNQKLYYHALGTPQTADQLIYARPDEPEWGWDPRVTDDGRYLIITVWNGTDPRTRVYYKDLSQTDLGLVEAPVVRLLDDFDAKYHFLGNAGETFYFQTNLEASNERVIAIDLKQPQRAAWRTLIPESEAVLAQVALIGDHFVVHALKDVKARLTIHGLDGALIQEIDLPAPGAIEGLSGERHGNELFYGFTSYLYPTTLYRYDFKNRTSEVFRAPEIDFDASQYETKQVFYKSKDGTSIPMFLTHKKGIKLDGSNPTFLYGYGGFNISITPAFSVSRLIWLEMGGVAAYPNLRGGAEYGEAWHQGGMLDQKQNVFDDFIGAAEYLIKEGYTQPKKLGIAGGSNGGLLVGACLTQRPDLFGAAWIAVGVLDMLRFQKFTIGWAWVPEYGTSDDPHQFKNLLKYSPLHNIRPNIGYPATLITTSDHDDRVVPIHSYKFGAALQAAQIGANPILVRIETKAGHGAGKPTSKKIEEQRDVWTFFAAALGVQ
ncbi:prolyl oligopeptidase family serine peptidase [Myxococcota bacterium]|nr:prolyl oligopeptidase family serine peptidase [Myxococcota bacterium]MBU1431801.1 prolyl oligopeptidase family serine peptidase [Myxococcota bacterium]MBU1896661.1 prolyl oligopeptidase family serine peptidase [Myxococcota bacterium]